MLSLQRINFLTNGDDIGSSVNAESNCVQLTFMKQTRVYIKYHSFNVLPFNKNCL